MPTLYDEIKGAGIDPKKFLTVYDLIKGVIGEVNLPHLKIPGMDDHDKGRVFDYMAENTGAVTKQNGIYSVNQEGVDAMNARIKSSGFRGVISRIKRRIHGE